MLLYGAASLAHFAHNAIYLRAYPALPAWITPLSVWLAWCGLTAVGAVGYWRYCAGALAAGFSLMMLYALLGFAGLDHYMVAPMSAHSRVMNATILIEVATAAVLLGYLALLLILDSARLRTHGVSLE